MIKRLFGQYANKDSAMHRLDARLKAALVILLSIFLFLSKNFVMMTAMTIIIFLLMNISKIEIGYAAKSLKPFAALAAMILLMYLLFSRDKMDEGIMSVWRFAMLVLASLVLTFTTTIGKLIKSAEYFLTPLDFFGGSSRNSALMMAITIRFVPHFFLYGKRAKDAQLARCADFRKPGNIRIFMLKMLDRMLKSASTLSDAIISRCYEANKK